MTTAEFTALRAMVYAALSVVMWALVILVETPQPWGWLVVSMYSAFTVLAGVQADAHRKAQPA